MLEHFKGTKANEQGGMEASRLHCLREVSGLLLFQRQMIFFIKFITGWKFIVCLFYGADPGREEVTNGGGQHQQIGHGLTKYFVGSGPL